MKQAHVVIAAFLGLVSGVVAFAFQVAPWLKPDPRDRIGADISIFALEKNVTLGRAINRGFPDPAPSNEGLNKEAPGELLYVRISVDGHKHRDVSLSLDFIKTPSQVQIRPQDLDLPPLGKVRRLSAPNERSVQVVWLPDMRFFSHRFVIRAALWDETGMLAVVDSPTVVKGLFVQAQPALDQG